MKYLLLSALVSVAACGGAGMKTYTPVHQKTKYSADSLHIAARDAIDQLGYQPAGGDSEAHVIETREKQVAVSSIPRLSYKYAFKIETTNGVLAIDCSCVENSATNEGSFKDCGDDRPQRVINEQKKLLKRILEIAPNAESKNVNWEGYGQPEPEEDKSDKKEEKADKKSDKKEEKGRQEVRQERRKGRQEIGQEGRQGRKAGQEGIRQGRQEVGQGRQEEVIRDERIVLQRDSGTAPALGTGPAGHQVPPGLGVKADQRLTLARVFRASHTVEPALVDSLTNRRATEHREGHVIVEAGHCSAGALRILRDVLGLGRDAEVGEVRAVDTATVLVNAASAGPCARQVVRHAVVAEIRQWVPERGELPVEDRENARLARVVDQVLETVIAVGDRRGVVLGMCSASHPRGRSSPGSPLLDASYCCQRDSRRAM